MSIIEHAIEKSRAAGQQPKRVRRAGEEVERTQRAAAIDPAARIVPLAITVDGAECRERRLLPNGAAGSDSAAVAAYRMLRTRCCTGPGRTTGG